MSKYDNLSREELIACLEKCEHEKERCRYEQEMQAERLKAEQAQERLAILKAAVNIGDSIIWEYDVETDTMYVDYELNSFGKEHPSRLKVEPFRNKEDFLNVIYPDDRQNVFYDHFERLIRGEIESYSIRYRRLFGDEVIWVEANVQPYKYNADGKPSRIVYYLSDITEQKLFEDKLYKLENKYRKIIKVIPDLIVTVDPDTRIVHSYTDESVYKQQGFFLRPGMTAEELFPEKVAVLLRKAINRVFAEKKEDETFFSFKLDGRERYFYCRVIPYEENQALVISRDVTENMRSRREIDSLNKLMGTILNNVPVVIAVKKINDDFKFVYFNRAAEQFTGIKAADAIGKTDWDVFSDQQRAAEIREADLFTVEAGKNYRYGIDYVTPSGKVKVVDSIRLVVNSVSSDDPALLISMVWDVTKARENELELLKAKEADRLKSAFLANMSHEIRTPLNAIVGFSSVLAETENAEERNEYLSIINRNNALLLQLIDDLLDFSKIESGKMEYHFAEVDLKEICTEMYYVHSLEIKADVQMIFNFEHASVFLHTDRQRVSQILSNLLTNALKFTHQGTITLSYQRMPKEVLVSVRDTGIGIPEKDLDTVFERFVKLDTYKQGTGLGLAICKMLVDRLGGKIGVDSEVGVGSIFWFTLPLKNQSEPLPEENAETWTSPVAPEIQSRESDPAAGVSSSPGIDQTPVNSMPINQIAVSETPVHPIPAARTDYSLVFPSGPAKKQKILIAEDIEENYYLLKVLLANDFTLYHARNGREAVDLFKAEQPDLILMDIKMPVMNGYEATQEIRTISSEIPIIALTAFAYEKEKEQAQACHFNEYIVKPVNIFELKKLLLKYMYEDLSS